VHEKLRSYTYIYPKPGDKTDVYADPSLTNGTWHHFAVVRTSADSATGIRYYLDGVYKNTADADSIVWDEAGVELALGDQPALTAVSFHGLVGDVRIYHDPPWYPTDQDILVLYLYTKEAYGK
jgi:hypothetical protein